MSEDFNASTWLVDRNVDEGRGSRLAVTGAGGQLTYAQLADRVSRAGAALQTHGVRPEERVVLFAADGPGLLAGILGAMRIGAVAVPVSTMLTTGELAALLRDARTRLLVVTEEFAATARTAAALAPEVQSVVDVRELAADGESAPYPTWDDSPALWLYTSGTTGRPKAAMHRHANIRHVAELYGRQVLAVRPDDRCLSVAKLFFAYGIGNSAFFPLSVGGCAVLDPSRPTPASMTRLLLAERPSLFFAVPTFYAALLAADVPPIAFGSVRLAVSAGEPLPAELYRRFVERYGVDILDGIGSTEALHIFISNRPGDVRPGSTGRPVPGYDVVIRDEDGRAVPPGEPGTLFVRGPSTAVGYWCRTDLSRQVFQGDWLCTGDSYLASDDGYYTYLGRTDDMIKAGGMWVSPTEVEARLLEHPSVGQAAVVAVPDEDGLDKPVAAVVPTTGAAVSPDELIAFCREGLAAYKRPRAVLVVDALPMTATGKLQRFAIRQLAAGRLTGERAEVHAAAGTTV